MSNEAVVVPDDSLSPIKHVTTEEAEYAAKLAKLRESDKAQLEAIQRETESLLLQTRADAEREREKLLTSSRAEGDREAETIVGLGSVRADGIRGKTSAELDLQKEVVLTAVLAEFRPPGKATSA
jgi:vacuolar-type H+-ATPase subunit H